MTVGPEKIPSHESESHELSYELQAEFASLLNDAADNLELCSRPDKITYQRIGARFGRYSGGLLDITHSITTDRGKTKHTGELCFSSEDDDDADTKQHSFRVERSPKMSDFSSDWKAYGEHITWTGGKVLQLLQHNWPTTDAQDLEALTKRYTDTTSPVTPEYILDLIEHYAMRNETGEYLYTEHWGDYGESSHFGDGLVDGEELDIMSDGKDELRIIEARFTVPFPLDGEIIPLQCTVACDQLGDVSIAAIYTDCEDQLRPKPIENFTGLYNELKLALEHLVEDKIDN